MSTRGSKTPCSSCFAQLHSSLARRHRQRNDLHTSSPRQHNSEDENKCVATSRLVWAQRFLGFRDFLRDLLLDASPQILLLSACVRVVTDRPPRRYREA